MASIDAPRTTPASPCAPVRVGGASVTVLGLLAVTTAAMYVHPHVSGLISRERQRELMAQADRQRLLRQLTGRARASWRTGRAGRAQRRAWRGAAALARLFPRHRAARG